MDDDQKARCRDDRLPEFGKIVPGRSRLRLGVASFCTGSEPAAPVVNFVLRHSGLERGEGVMTKDILSLSALALPHSG